MSPVGTEFDVSEGYGKFTSAKQRPPVGVGRISTSSAPCGAASESLIQPTAVWLLARPALPKAKLPWGTFPSRGRLLEDAATITLAFPFRGFERPENSPVDCFQRERAGRPLERWQQGGKSIGFAGLPIGQTATAKSEILTPHHPLMLTDEVLFPPTPTGGHPRADPSE